jgi:hypothetical protein
LTPPSPSQAAVTLAVLHAPGKQRVAGEVLARRPVRFRNNPVRIVPFPCGSTLSEIVRR